MSKSKIGSGYSGSANERLPALDWIKFPETQKTVTYDAVTERTKITTNIGSIKTVTKRKGKEKGSVPINTFLDALFLYSRVKWNVEPFRP